MHIISLRGHTPQFGQNCFIAETAVVIGDVNAGDDCSIWFNAVVRGDVNSIVIGNNVNIQDGAIIHCTYEKSITEIGDNVSIGHNAIVHGCKIEANCLIGMGSIIMDLALVQENCIIGAGAVVLENSICESGYIYAGVPAKKIKPIGNENMEFYIKRTANNYKEYANWFKEK